MILNYKKKSVKIKFLFFEIIDYEWTGTSVYFDIDKPTDKKSTRWYDKFRRGEKKILFNILQAIHTLR